MEGFEPAMPSHESPQETDSCRPAIYRTRSRLLRHFAITLSRASYTPDGWPAQWAAMTKKGQATGRAMRERADFKCAPHSKTATCCAVANWGRGPAVFFDKQNEQIRCTSSMGHSHSISGGSKGNSGDPVQGGGGERDFRKTTIKMLCRNGMAAPIWSGHAKDDEVPLTGPACRNAPAPQSLCRRRGIAAPSCTTQRSPHRLTPPLRRNC